MFVKQYVPIYLFLVSISFVLESWTQSLCFFLNFNIYWRAHIVCFFLILFPTLDFIITCLYAVSSLRQGPYFSVSQVSTLCEWCAYTNFVMVRFMSFPILFVTRHSICWSHIQMVYRYTEECMYLKNCCVFLKHHCQLFFYCVLLTSTLLFLLQNVNIYPFLLVPISFPSIVCSMLACLCHTSIECSD